MTELQQDTDKQKPINLFFSYVLVCGCGLAFLYRLKLISIESGLYRKISMQLGNQDRNFSPSNSTSTVTNVWLVFLSSQEPKSVSPRSFRPPHWFLCIAALQILGLPLSYKSFMGFQRSKRYKIIFCFGF